MTLASVRDTVDDESLAALRARLTELNLPVWTLDSGGRCVAAPDLDGAVGSWLSSGGMCRRIERTVRNAGSAGGVGSGGGDSGGGDAAETAWLFDGCRLVTLSPHGVRGPFGQLALALLTPRAAGAAEIREAAAAMGVAEGELRRGISVLAHGSDAEADRTARLVEWMRDDLIGIGRDKRLLGQYGFQLSEMYEEIALLYRLGQSMTGLPVPQEFVRTTLTELSQTLPFAWVAIKFVDNGLVAPGLRREITVAGRPPISVERLDELASSLVGGLEIHRWRLLEPGAGHPLADAIGAEALAHPISRGERLVGVLLAGNKTSADADVNSFETQLLDAAADFMNVFVDNAGLYADQRSLFMGTIQALSAAIDAKDPYTRGHSERVAHLAKNLALAAGLDEERAERVRIAGLLHDVGKIGVPEAVLCKPGALTDTEFELIKLHPTIGYRILKDIAMLADILPGVLYHHEHFSGRGYPEGLAGDSIPFIARILSVADSFDAMSSNRSYRAALPRKHVLAEITRSAGRQFDPDLARVFVTMNFAEYDRLVKRHEVAAKRAA